MQSLPDDVWHKILQMGIESKRLHHTDLCSLAIVNSYFDQLTTDTSHWANLLSRDFSLCFLSPQAPSKDLYRKKHEIRRFIRSRAFVSRFDLLEELLLACDSHSIWEPIRTDEPLFHFPIQSQQSVNISVDGIEDGLSSHQQGDSVPSHASRPIMREECKQYFVNKPSKRFDKSSRPKVIPNSKSYIPMNRPPLRSMPRKIRSD